jgi:drug/metabolite transporter (DMT)-like permease
VTSKQLSRPAAHALLHVTVLLWGFTAILGRQISISAVPLVWYRLLVSAPVLAALVVVRGHRFAIPRRALVHYAIVGALIAAHWLCFYGAIKVAGLPLAVVSLSTISFFTALLEPIVFHRAVDRSELAIGAVVVAGVTALVYVELHVTAGGGARSRRSSAC